MIFRKHQFLKFTGIISSLFLAQAVFAVGPIQFTEETTLEVNGINLTVEIPSEAVSLTIDNTGLTVTTSADATFTVKQSQKLNMTTNKASVTQKCLDTFSRITVPISTTVTINASTGGAVCPSEGAAVAAGGGGSGSSPSSATSTSSASGSKSDTQPELPYFQLPEKNETGIKLLSDKSVKFPTSGKVTKKTLMKNTENKSSYLLQFGAKVKKSSDGKPYTGLVMGPRTIGIANNLPGIKLPKGSTILDRTEVQFEEPVKISGKFELKMPIPQEVAKKKNFNPKDKKRFKIYNYNTKSKKWKSAGLALVGKDKKNVYVKTSKYGFFILVDTKAK